MLRHVLYYNASDYVWPWQCSGVLRLPLGGVWCVVGHQVGGRTERRAERGQRAVTRDDAHHQMTPRGKIHVHLSSSEEVLSWRRKYTNHPTTSTKYTNATIILQADVSVPLSLVKMHRWRLSFGCRSTIVSMNWSFKIQIRKKMFYMFIVKSFCKKQQQTIWYCDSAKKKREKHI